MTRTMIFAKRNLLEMSRDPLSYVFCAAFPIVMLAVMSVLDASIPPEAGMTVFRLDNLLGGIIVFGHTFLMLFAALTVSQDRYGSFLMRLYASPMKSGNFTIGYILPMILVGVVQSMLTIAAAVVVSLITGFRLNAGGLVLAVVGAVPSAVMFVSIGIIFGTLFSRNSAPGLCSVVISLGSFMGGIWFDAEGAAGAIGTACRCLPFIYAVRSVRGCVKAEFSVGAMAVTAVTAAVLLIAADALFRMKMRADLE